MCSNSWQNYILKKGSIIDRTLLIRFMKLTYQEMFPHQKDFSHLTQTVNQYLTKNTIIWWVKDKSIPIACIWGGNAIDQQTGDRQTHIFLLYVKPLYRNQGIATMLLEKMHDYASEKGDRRISLMVYEDNKEAINLYKKLGYQTSSYWMERKLTDN